MISFTPLASSSAGNSYRLSDGVTTLLLEAGIPFKPLREAFNFRLSDLAGCLITHEHKDHSKSAMDLMQAGVNVYASQGTEEAAGLSGHRLKRIAAHRQFKIGTWTILPFDVEHDAAEPLGFLFQNEKSEKLVFITDTYYCRYRFSGLTHIAIECNYDIRILNENVISGRIPSMLKRRIIRSHFSLNNVKDFLKANDVSKVREIHLLHLSDNNSDEQRFRLEVQQVTGKPVYIAGK
jgi:phosphoribosyl 1,2-cyclic phosphodiesterase